MLKSCCITGHFVSSYRKDWPSFFRHDDFFCQEVLHNDCERHSGLYDRACCSKVCLDSRENSHSARKSCGNIQLSLLLFNGFFFVVVGPPPGLKKLMLSGVDCHPQEEGAFGTRYRPCSGGGGSCRRRNYLDRSRTLYPASC